MLGCRWYFVLYFDPYLDPPVYEREEDAFNWVKTNFGLLFSDV